MDPRDPEDVNVQINVSAPNCSCAWGILVVFGLSTQQLITH